MADVQVNADYIEWLRTSADSPVADALDHVADLVLAEAVALAPVSARGSRYAPPGFTKSRIRKSGPLTIRADARSTHQAVVTAMDVAGRLGFAQLNIATVHQDLSP